MRAVVQFLKDNPQAAILLAICLVLGLGTLIALMISMVGSGGSASDASNAGVVTLLGILGG